MMEFRWDVIFLMQMGFIFIQLYSSFSSFVSETISAILVSPWTFEVLSSKVANLCWKLLSIEMHGFGFLFLRFCCLTSSQLSLVDFVFLYKTKYATSLGLCIVVLVPFLFSIKFQPLKLLLKKMQPNLVLPRCLRFFF